MSKLLYLRELIILNIIMSHKKSLENIEVIIKSRKLGQGYVISGPKQKNKRQKNIYNGP